MRPNRIVVLVAVLFVLAVATLSIRAEGEETGAALTRCSMTYRLSGWSAFYKTMSGEGTVTCENGESAKVVLKFKGGGLSFGKSDVLDGTGEFTGVRGLEEVFGSYAAAQAHAGAGKSAQASVYTKGEVSLALTGKGRGIDLGVAFGKLSIGRP